MKFKLMPRSNSRSVYATLATIPFLGAFAGILCYEYCRLDAVADAAFVLSKAFAVYSSAVIFLKLLLLTIRHHGREARNCLLTTLGTVGANILILAALIAIEFFR